MLSDDLKQEIQNGNAVECAECGWIGPRIQWTHLKYKCSGKIATIDEYKKKYPNRPLVARNAAKLLGCTREKLIDLYGEEQGELLWDDYRNKQAKSNSFEYKALKHGWTKEKFQQFNKERAVTLENLIKKHGEEVGTVKWENYCERQKYTCTLEYFKKTHGPDVGEQKYFNFVRKRSCNKAVSNIELVVFEECKEIIPELEQQISIGHPYYNPYDFGSVHKRKLIEFYGTYWHCDPRQFTEEFLVRQRNMTAKEIRSRDQAKRSLAINQGFKVFVIWELDWVCNKTQVLENLSRWWNED